MKTKSKMVAMAEIAIVLCSVFLVAMPAVAADQNQEMQKVSANTITTASEDDFVLDIYGNANEDDTIDMRDLTYVKLIFFGKKPETELADAKYDGKINPLDFIQIKLIIVGKEKELTIVDDVEVVTVHKPVKRIIILQVDSAQVLRSLDAEDKIIGVTTQILDEEEVFFPQLSKLPCVGTFQELDYEAILNLRPDLLLKFFGGSKYIDKEKLPGVTTIYLGLRPQDFIRNVRKLGYILGKKEEADEFINWHTGITDEIKSRTEGLSEDEKPKVFIWGRYKSGGGYITVWKGNRQNQACVIAGGNDISENLVGRGWHNVDPEWVMEQNPDVITASGDISSGYDIDDPSGMATAREEILNRPELANVNAVKNGRVYMTDSLSLFTGSGGIIGTAYYAKWFHPELFEDLDPTAIHQKYLTRFQGLDFDLDEHGVFVYHPEEHPDGK